jgi:hypothetical protein
LGVDMLEFGGRGYARVAIGRHGDCLAQVG